MSGPFGSTQLFGVAAGAAPGYVPKGAIWLNGTDEYLHRTPSGAGNRKTYSFSCWAKISNNNTSNGYLIDAGTIGGSSEGIRYSGSSSCPLLIAGVAGSGNTALQSTAIYRDPTAWQHVFYTKDTTDSIGFDRVRMYVNGREIYDFTTRNNPALDAEGPMNNDVLHRIGAEIYASTPATSYNGYISEVILLDGYARPPSDFGTEDANGVWIPKDPTDSVTAYKGTNGFWLDFADTTSTTTLGYDVSGNDNHFSTSSGIASGTSNWTYDRPADSGTDTGNLCILNPLTQEGGTLSGGNLTYDVAGGSNYVMGSIAVSSGKWYWEYIITGTGFTGGIAASSLAGTTINNGFATIGAAFSASDGGYGYMKINNAPWNGTDGVYSTNGTTAPDAGSRMQVFLNLDDNEIQFGNNDNTGTAAQSITAGTYVPLFGRNSLNDNGTAVFSEGDWTYSAPAGYSALGTQNLPAPTVTKPSDNFLPIIYEGTGTGQRVGNFIPFTDAYTVDDSARFDVGDTDYLSKTDFGGSGTGAGKTWTYSVWVKRAALSTGYGQTLFGVSNPGVDSGMLKFDGPSGTVDNGLLFWIDDPANGTWYFRTKRQFESTDSWTHIVVAVDTDQAVSTNIVKIYFNGVLEFNYYEYDTVTRYTDTLFGQDYDHAIGYDTFHSNTPCDGYMAEAIFVDGYQLDASVFGQTDTSTNRWIPKEVTVATLNTAGGGSSGFGTNGFYLDMAMENSLGNDVSGNNNDFTMSVGMDNTNGSNQMYDTPTRNYNVMDGTFLGASWGTALASGLTQGNLKFTRSSGDTMGSAFMGAGSGKWYVEIVMDTVVTSNSNMAFGIVDLNNSIANQNFATGTNSYTYRNYTGSSTSPTTGQKMPRATTVTAGTGYAAGDVLGIALDLDAGYMWAAKNNTWFNDADGSAGNPTAGTFPLLTGIAPSGPSNPAKWAMSLYFNDNHAATFNFGQWRYFDGGTTTLDTTADGYFKYTPPTDFLAFHQDNLPENTAGITGFSWIKNRDAADDHILEDRVRGIYKYLISNDTDIEVTNTNSVQRFLQQGVQVGNMDAVNTSAESFVLWNWVANGTGTTNTEGTITSTVSANTTAGFSIATYTGSSNTTFGHGLSTAPKLVMIKRRDVAAQWAVWHTSLTSTQYYLNLDDAGAEADYGSTFISTSSTLVTIDASSSLLNNTGDTYVCYCWAEVEGYSKFGSYEGNTDNDGPCIYLGFKPSILIWKNIDSGSASWRILDNKRNPYNPVNHRLFPNDSGVESDNSSIDFTANGFKVITNSSDVNTNTIVYAAWAENPFGGSGVAQAKAR
jgi:hypothetical protein